MEILFLMVPLAMALVGLGIWAFFWAVGSGQFDDLDSPGWSVLGDDKKRRAGEDDDASDDGTQGDPAEPREPPRS